MDNRAAQYFSLAISTLSVTSIAVALRCYVRLRLKKGTFWIDDALAVVSFIFFLLQSVSLIVGSGMGIFGHYWTDLTREALETGMKLILIYELSYTVATCLAKQSICMLLLRFAIERVYIYTIYSVFALVTVFSIFYFFYILLQCNPVARFWEQPVRPPAACHREGTVVATYFHSVVLSVSDWTLGILPIFFIRSMNLCFRTKLYVASVLALGSCASIATLARFAYIKVADDPKNLFFDTGLIIWSHLEIAIALTASSAATFRPLVTCLKPSCRRHNRPDRGEGMEICSRIGSGAENQDA